MDVGEGSSSRKGHRESGRNMELYNITKTLAGKPRRQEVGVKDKQGVINTEAQERLQRWVEHFSEILNRDVPMNPVEEDGEKNWKRLRK